MSKFKFEDFKINYQAIRLMKNYLTDGQFIRLFKGYDVNHFIFDDGFIYERILHKVSIGYLDLSLDDNDSVGRQKLRALGCSYNIFATMKLKDAPEGYESFRDNYEIVLIEIVKEDYDKFVMAMSSVINTAFNDRDVEYFELLRSVLKLGYPNIPKGIKRNPMKFNHYYNYIDIEREHCKIEKVVLEELKQYLYDNINREDLTIL